MKSYFSIRKLHLPNRPAITAELRTKDTLQIDAFEKLYGEWPFTIKLKLHEENINADLASACSLRSLPCMAVDDKTAYIFANKTALQDWSREQFFRFHVEELLIADLRGFLERQFRSVYEMVSERYMFNFGGPTRLMGVLNVTPDSFFDGDRYANKNAAVERGFQMEEEGADIIDIGGESTRPGAVPVNEAEELARIVPVIEALAGEIKIPISVDTYKAPVAEAAIQAGATIVNDISGLQFDPHLLEVVAHYGIPVVIMHIKGRPQDMQVNPTYENVMDELYEFFENGIEKALKAGIERSRIIIDPGLGFGKRLWDNYEILQRLPELKGLGCPILVGPSRKSFIGKILNLPVEERLEGTSAAVTSAVANGCQLVRVHDVKEMLRVVQVADLICGNVVLEGQELDE